MELFHKILKTAVEGGSSYVHFENRHAGHFPHQPKLVAVDAPFPSQEWMNKIVEAITPAHLKKRLDEEREIDFSYFAPHIRALPHEPFPAAQPLVPGDALRENERAEF